MNQQQPIPVNMIPIIDITLIIEGREKTISALADEPLFEVVGREMGVTGQERLNGYEYRSADGVLLESWRSIGQLLRFGSGKRLFVNQRAGVGA